MTDTADRLSAYAARLRDTLRITFESNECFLATLRIVAGDVEKQLEAEVEFLRRREFADASVEREFLHHG